MGEIILVYFNFLKSKSTHLSIRVLLTIIMLIPIFVFNDISGLTRTYFLNQRLTQLVQLKTLNPNILTTDKDFQKSYIELKAEILYYKPITISAWEYFRTIPIGKASFIPNDPIKSNTPTGDSIVESNHRIIWFDISSMLVSYLTMFLCVALIISTPFTKADFENKLRTIIGSILILLITYLLGRSFKAILLWIIPIYKGHLWINYIINILFQAIISWAIARSLRKYH